MSLFLNSILSRNRRSRVPVEEIDPSEDMNVETNNMNENRNETNVETGEGRIMNNGNSLEERNADSHDNSSNDSDSTNDSHLGPGSLSLSQQEVSRFQILRQTRSPRNAYSRTETDDQNNSDSTDTQNSNNADFVDHLNEVARRRRQSTVTIILLLFLFKLWIDALAEGDPALLFLCITCTFWFSSLLRRQRDENWAAQGRFSRGGLTEDERILENMGLSYQAQLNAAIWESRMLSMMGGIAEREEPLEGVSEDNQSNWQRFEVNNDLSDTKKGSGYGVLRAISGNKSSQCTNTDVVLGCEEDATCSICLCEYENKDQVIQLPCKHLYHSDCVLSWTENHIRCPLCNYDLENEEANAIESMGSNPESSETSSPLESV